MEILFEKFWHLFLFLIIPLFSFLLIMGCDKKAKEFQPEEIVEKPEYEGTIIAVGDSLTAGYGVAEEEAYPTVLQKKMHRNGHNWQVVNAGISGETSRGALERVKWIMAQKPSIVIFATGANDGLRGIATETIYNNISQAVQMLEEKNITVILAGMQIVQNLGVDYTNDFAALYFSIAKERNIFFIPFILEDVASIPSLNQADTIHPNSDGHRIIAETVYPYVIEAISANEK